MESVSVSTRLLYNPKTIESGVRSDYRIDFWREVKRRWLVVGVLVAVLLAVISPRAGAPGGPLHTEYLSYLPLSYIYYSAGRCARHAGHTGPGACPAGGSGAGQWRAMALGVAHCHAVAPALCVLTAGAFRDTGVDHRVMRGAILSSVGAPCGWLALSVRPGWGPAAGGGDALPPAALVAANYVTSLLATPLLMLLLCGQATVPPLGGIVSTALISATPFALGALRPAGAKVRRGVGARLAALLVLYAECCERLRAAEGSLYVGDVLGTLMLVLAWAGASAGACRLYGRGALAPRDARTVACCSVPKCLDIGWESSTSCTPSGLSLLPAAFLAPAQALLLAAGDCDDEDDEPEDDGDHALPQ